MKYVNNKYKHNRSKSNDNEKAKTTKDSDTPVISRRSWGANSETKRLPQKNELFTPLLFDQITLENSKDFYSIEKNAFFEPGDDAKIDKIFCYRIDDRKYIIFSIFCIFTFFFIAILTEFFPYLKLKLKFKKCSVMQSTHFVIETKEKKIFFVEPRKIKLPTLSNNSVILNYTKIPITSNETIIFEFKLRKYAYCSLIDNFVMIKFVLNNIATYEVIGRKMSTGLNEKDIAFQENLYKLSIEKVDQIRSVVKLLLIELKNPFYLIQFFCIIFWLCSHYPNYAALLIVVTIITVFLGVFEVKQNINLINKITNYSCKVNVFRTDINGKRVSQIISSKDLLPGDVFEVPNGSVLMPCDALLISGKAIMNESFLTGESNPIFKSNIPNSTEKFNPKNDSRFILYSGTKILQTRNKALAIVLGVGLDTKKGNLIRAILFKTDSNSFTRKSIYEMWKLILFILSVGIIAIFFFAVPKYRKFNYSFKEILYKCCDLFSVLMPAALPGCNAINISICLLKIKNKGIKCLDRRKINLIGNVDIICFDKTGTLTEDDVDLYGYRLITYNNGNFIFQKFTDDISDLISSGYDCYKSKSNDKVQQLNKFYIECLACCNSLTKIDGTLIGDPIDIEMFKSSEWNFDETVEEDKGIFMGWVRPKNQSSLKTSIQLGNNESDVDVLKSRYEIGIARRFEFLPKLQRMSVIVKNMNEDFFTVFCKGSPEKIRELCKTETIPSNYNKILTKYTNHGLRVLAMCFKMVKMDFVQCMRIARESVEHEMRFLGFFIVGNKLRNKTKPTIDIVKNAEIKTIISTGDNLFTAISVGKECHIIDEDEDIYQCDIIPIRDNYGKTTYHLTMKEIIVDIDDESEEEEESEDSSDETIYKNMSSSSMSKRRLSKLTKNLDIDSVSEDDMESESDGYEENDIHLNLAFRQNEINANDISILKIDENIKISSNSVFAINGETFEILHNLSQTSQNIIYREIFNLVLEKTVIYGRMLPETKAKLIECLKDQKTDKIVAMVGDGANDIYALRAADVGISLGLDDTVVSANFICSSPEIKSIIRLICEGKTCIVNKIECYKYMILLNFVKFYTCILLAKFNSTLSNNQCMITDFFIVFPNAFLLSRTDSLKILTIDRVGIITTKKLLPSFIFQFLIMGIFQYSSCYLIQKKSWYTETSNERRLDFYNDIVEPCYENTLLFLIGFLQCLICVIISSSSKPFKKGILDNRLLLGYLIIMGLFGYYLILVPESGVDEVFQMKEIEDQGFRFIIILFTISNFLLSLYIEKEVLPYVMNQIKTIK